MILFLFVKENHTPNPSVWSVREAFCSFGEEGVFSKGPSNLFHVFRDGQGFKIKTKDSEFQAESDKTFSVGSYNITMLLIPEPESSLYGEYRIGPIRHRFPMLDEISIGRSSNCDIIIPLSGVGISRLKRELTGIKVITGEAINIDEWNIRLLPSEIEVKFSPN